MMLCYIYIIRFFLYWTILYKKNIVGEKVVYDIKGKLWNNYKLLRFTGQKYKQHVLCYPRYGKDNLSKNRIKLSCLCK